MFTVAKLVHADLSEYNLLYLDKQVYVIDVSQSVEQDHPNAYKFLEMDCRNVNNWFRKQGILTCTGN
jgi:RIO kinase 1